MIRSKIELSVVDQIAEIIAIGGTISALLLVVIHFGSIPDAIPKHFNFNGEVNATGSKYYLLAFPVVSLVVYLSLTKMPKLPLSIRYPFKIREENAEQHLRNVFSLMRFVKCLIILDVLYITYASIQIALGKMDGLGTWFVPIAISSLLLVIAFFMARGYKLN